MAAQSDRFAQLSLFDELGSAVRSGKDDKKKNKEKEERKKSKTYANSCQKYK